MQALTKAKDKLVSAVNFSAITTPVPDDPLATERYVVLEYGTFLQALQLEIGTMTSLFESTLTHKAMANSLMEVPFRCPHAVTGQAAETIQNFVTCQEAMADLTQSTLKPDIAKLTQTLTAQNQLVSTATLALTKRERAYGYSVTAKGEMEKAKATNKAVDKMMSKYKESTDEFDKCTSECKGLCAAIVASHDAYVQESTATLMSLYSKWFAEGVKIH